MAFTNARVFLANTQLPPIVSELEAIFSELPDEKLVEKLKGPRRTGRPGYDPEILWRCFIAHYYLGLPSVSDLVRILHDNPFIAQACGLDWPNVPSQPTFSRFGTKLAKKPLVWSVKAVLRSLTLRLYDEHPDFGKSVAIDSTDIKAWSNGNRKGHKRGFAEKRTRRHAQRWSRLSEQRCPV